MTKRDDLIALRDTVTAGGVGWNTIANMCEEAGIATVSAQHAAEAYTGSLDAALRLHKALLPETCWALASTGPVEGETRPTAMVVRGNREDWVDVEDQHVVSAAPPARAFLLAIIEALIAQEDASASG